jgi:hypothetical protein
MLKESRLKRSIQGTKYEGTHSTDEINILTLQTATDTFQYMEPEREILK